MCFKILPPCKVCCLTESQFFKYVNRVERGIPYAGLFQFYFHFCPLF
jgi:hypothetical protein